MYFQWTNRTQDKWLLTNHKRDKWLLTNRVQANGFYGARGVSGAIPSAYTYIAEEFARDVESRGQQSRVRLLEYSRPGWTFHAKGLWCCQPLAGGLPHLTVIGSSNFGQYSLMISLVDCLLRIFLQNELHEISSRIILRWFCIYS